MKHYVLGLIFNRLKSKILLVEKKRPKWQAGFWNGIGGKIEQDEEPIRAMERKTIEETSYSYTFNHTITFMCPGGTVFVYKAICPTTPGIVYKQKEDERLRIWSLHNLPENMMGNLRWIIPLSLSSVQFPIVLQQNGLGVHR